MDVPGENTVHSVDDVGQQVKQLFSVFLTSFRRGSSSQTREDEPYYILELRDMMNESRTTLYIDWRHLVEYDDTLAGLIQANYTRFEPFLRRAVQDVYTSLSASTSGNSSVSQSAAEAAALARENGGNPENTILYVGFYNLPKTEKLRDLRTNCIGTLVALSATVTRTSEVRPELLYGTFRCMDCQTEVQNVEQQFKFTEPKRCLSATCFNTQRWNLDLEKSVFTNWQKCHVQENSWEIPSGSMPRTMDVILRNENVERAKAGDKVVFVGTVVVIPDVSKLGATAHGVTSYRNDLNNEGLSEGVSGLRDLGSARLLSYKMAFLACCVHPLENNSRKAAVYGTNNDDDDDDDGNLEEDIAFGTNPEMADDGNDQNSRRQQQWEATIAERFTPDELKIIHDMRAQPDLYTKMVQSVAPNIYGHEDVKRGVLLLMFGGVHKRTPEGISLRGDINVCIIGDPSTAKSQFLKYVCSFYPRAVFTSGKASTAAGMTASVVRDDDTGEFNIEAGALMLADNGICCIDEFDKMDIVNQVAIHETMEQQTISIAKAGIHATLNARTSILAAANPIGGRYDRAKPLRANFNIGAPLMSRFDLFFIVLDDCDELVDRQVADYIVGVHQHLDDAMHPPFNTEQMRLYIRYAHCIKPVIGPDAMALFAEHYSKLRQNDTIGASRSSYRITVRQLESLIRLAEALARLHLDNEVKPAYVDEAARLLRKSIIHVDTQDVVLSDLSGESTMASALQQLQSASGQGANSSQQQQQQQKQMTLSADRYAFMSKALVLHMERLSAGSDDNGSASGMHVGDLVKWYVQEHPEDLTEGTTPEILATTVRLVIKRMLEVDNTLLSLTPRSMPSLTLDDDTLPSLDDIVEGASTAADGSNEVPEAEDVESFDELVVKPNPNYDPHDG